MSKSVVSRLQPQTALPKETGQPRSGCFLFVIASGVQMVAGSVLTRSDWIMLDGIGREARGWNGLPIITWQDRAKLMLRCTDPTAWGQLVADFISPGTWRFEQTGGWDSHDGGPTAYPYPWARRRSWRFMASYWKRPAGGHYTLVFPEFDTHWNPNPALALIPHTDFRVFDMWEAA